MKTAIYLQGAKGRMGRGVAALIQEDSAFSLTDTLSASDVVVDVSAPSALPVLLERCLEAKKPLVIGTTGFDETQKQMMQDAAHYIPLLYAPNFSFGMALLKIMATDLAKQVSGTMKIVEEHHVSKKDAPSGSALMLAEAIGKDVAIDSIRNGDTVGVHTIIFELGEERLELKHQVFCRTVFAKGALRAAQFLKDQPPGYYTLCHLLK